MLSHLNEVLSLKSLSREKASDLMAKLIDGVATAEQTAGILIALRLKGESVEEISGFLDCLKKRANPYPFSREDLIDVCGTGGDGLGTFNISTTAAFVVAATGQKVAKHGNRMISSQSGSFDVLEALGIHYESDPEKISKSIEENGIGFFFAPAFHPSLKVLIPLRRNLGVHTVFNALGPLLNPANVKRQLIGAYSAKLLSTLAQVLHSQGAKEAMVVRGEDGLDELTLGGKSKIAHLKDGKVKEYEVQPEDFGLNRAPLEALRGAGAKENAAILIQILKGEKSPRRDVVLLNASAALIIGGAVESFKQGIEKAQSAIDSGAALRLLERVGVKK